MIAESEFSKAAEQVLSYCSVSNGSACTSKSYSPSYVLEAMGIPVEDIESSVRISWEPETNKTEFIDNVSKMIEIAKSLAVWS